MSATTNAKSIIETMDRNTLAQMHLYLADTYEEGSLLRARHLGMAQSLSAELTTEKE